MEKKALQPELKKSMVDYGGDYFQDFYFSQGDYSRARKVEKEENAKTMELDRKDSDEEVQKQVLAREEERIDKAKETAVVCKKD